jgi:hypothetical protein
VKCGNEPSAVKGRLVVVGVSLLRVLCIAGSVAASFWWRSEVRTQDRRAFEATSADIVASMSSTLRRDTDFLAAPLRSTNGSRPDITNAEFVLIGRTPSVTELDEFIRMMSEPTHRSALSRVGVGSV